MPLWRPSTPIVSIIGGQRQSYALAERDRRRCISAILAASFCAGACGVARPSLIAVAGSFWISLRAPRWLTTSGHRG